MRRWAVFGETATNEIQEIEESTRLQWYGGFLVKKGNENPEKWQEIDDLKNKYGIQIHYLEKLLSEKGSI